MAAGTTVDVVVLGAGMTGAATAWSLAGRATVALVEAEQARGMHSTGRSAAVLTTTTGSPRVRELTVASRAFFAEPPEGFADVPLALTSGSSTMPITTPLVPNGPSGWYTRSYARRMPPDPTDAPKQRVRRPPPRFRPVELARLEHRTPHLVRATFVGAALAGYEPPLPAGSVRLLVPSPGASQLVMPVWNGNEFLLPDGSRPTIRTYTPLRFDADALELDLDIVLHPAGAVAAWAERARPGDAAAISGPGRGYDVDQAAASWFLAGDETAVPAIGQLLEALPASASVEVLIEVARPDARADLPDHPGGDVTWVDLTDGAEHGSALVDAVRGATIAPDAKVWAAGEAAAVQRIRKHLFDERGLARSQATVRGYWKRGRAGD